MPRRILIATLLVAGCLAGRLPGEPGRIEPAEFAKLHAMFKTQPGESRFWELPWMIQLDAALKRGAYHI